MIAEGIFNSKIRYGIFVYLTPIFEKEDLKIHKAKGQLCPMSAERDVGRKRKGI